MIREAIDVGCRSNRLLRIHNVHAYLGAVAADFRHIHRVAEDGQRVELAGDFGAEVVPDFPDAFGELEFTAQEE